jgi:uncharacterized protein
VEAPDAEPLPGPPPLAPADPFAEWQPMAPAARTRHVGWALVLLPFAAAGAWALVVFASKHRAAAQAGAAALSVFALWNLLRAVVWSRAFRFRLTATTVETRSRFVVTRTRYVPLGRIQHVDVSSGPIEQSLGIANVVAHTAAGDATIVVPGVVNEVAGALRDRLLSERRLEAT